MSDDIEEIKKLCTENLKDGANINPELIAAAINDYSKQWVIEAIREAVLSNNLTWGYVLGILHNCQNEGHSPSAGRLVDPPSSSSCAGCNHHRSRNGQPERCAVGHHPPSKCEDYQPPRSKVDIGRGQRR